MHRTVSSDDVKKYSTGARMKDVQLEKEEDTFTTLQDQQLSKWQILNRSSQTEQEHYNVKVIP